MAGQEGKGAQRGWLFFNLVGMISQKKGGHLITFMFLSFTKFLSRVKKKPGRLSFHLDPADLFCSCKFLHKTCHFFSLSYPGGYLSLIVVISLISQFPGVILFLYFFPPSNFLSFIPINRWCNNKEQPNQIMVIIAAPLSSSQHAALSLLWLKLLLTSRLHFVAWSLVLPHGSTDKKQRERS